MADTLQPADYEKLGLFYLGRPWDLDGDVPRPGALLYDSRDLLTHALCVGMTGSGKTGLCIGLLEEAAIDGVPALVIDPKGDLGNLLLTFPDLAPADFLPWVEEEAAQRKGMSREDLAASEAKKWRDGLASWGEGPDRIRRLRDAAEVTIYTPGSTAGRPLAVLASLAAPPAALREDAEMLRERVTTTAAGLLGLLGIEADPVRSREHILLSTLLERAWSAGAALDLPNLVAQVQRPPIAKVGVMELDSFYPEKDRFELAMALNNLLASPGFASWLQGEPLDVDRMLYTAEGKPRIAICSIGHLSERERMFFVTLLLDQTLAWVRTRPGTSSLRAVLYMDEVFGYLPPVAEPPSKRPLLTLLKQARAFGLGVVLATQNPVDLDYKGLTNIGTWFLGRLQADRDKQRLLDGLEGASGGAGPSRQELDATLSRLRNRLFLLHDVHAGAPVVFETRWTLSYLRGPLTRQEVRRLSAEGSAEDGASGGIAAATTAGGDGAAAAASTAGATAGGATAPASAVAGGITSASLSLPATVVQLWEPGGAGEYRAALLGKGRARYRDARKGIEHAEEVAVVATIPTEGEEIDWLAAQPLGRPLGELLRRAPDGAVPAAPPDAASRAGAWRAWESTFKRHLKNDRALTLWRSPSLGELSRPGEGERELRIRLGEQARGMRAAQLDAVRARWAKRAESAQTKVAKAQQVVATQEGQLHGQQMSTAISVGATVLSALFGRKKLTLGTLGRATTAARGAGRAMQEKQDVDTARQRLATAQAELAELERQMAADVAAADVAARPEGETLEEVRLAPREVEVDAVSLLWRRV
ncbi:MAG TPA: ATP-binding protein [Thermoanaerobaculia bacterium]|nr:ATP-binding protein [Thermoanaerobaculia bacterium]